MQQPKVFQSLVQLASSFMTTTIVETFNELISNSAMNTKLPFSAAQFAIAAGLKEDLATRFLNAAISVELLQRDEKQDLQINSSFTPPNSLKSETLFWLVRNRIDYYLTTPKDYSEVHRYISNLTDATSLTKFNYALEAKLLTITENKISISSAVHCYLNPTQADYIGAWISNYDKIASRIFTKSALIAALRSGETQWEHAFGVSVKNPFDLAIKHRELFVDLMEGMHQANASETVHFAKNIDLSDVKTVMDVGGASGAWAIALAKTAEHIEEIAIYELNTAVPFYKSMYARYARDNNYPIHFVEGDFFINTVSGCLYSLPTDKKFDLITMGWILHDWKDCDAQKILSKVKHHLKHNGQLILAEAVLPESRLGPGTLLDLLMILQTGGKERTLSEYEALLGPLGFQIQNTRDIGTRRNLIVARNAGQ